MSQRFANAISVGDVLNQRYQITEVLGQGGMGSVFKAIHLSLNKAVAVKALHPHIILDQNALARFQQEIKAMSILSHPHLISVLDVGTADSGTPYFVMEFLDGPSLADLLKMQGPPPDMRAIRMFIQMADALAYAHQKGIVHRDLKPSNVVVLSSSRNKDFIKLVDLGIAKLLTPINGEQLGLTITGEIFGSPLYMSPEQCLANPVDARSDIYSFGCLMFETASGKPPIIGGSALETFNLHVSKEAPLISQVYTGQITPALKMLEPILFKCMQKQPEDRFQTMAEVCVSLENIERQSPGQLSSSDQSASTGQSRSNSGASAGQSASVGQSPSIDQSAPSSPPGKNISRDGDAAALPGPESIHDAPASAVRKLGSTSIAAKTKSILLNRNALAGIGTFAFVMIVYNLLSPSLHHQPPAPPAQDFAPAVVQQQNLTTAASGAWPKNFWPHYSVRSPAVNCNNVVEVVAVKLGEGQPNNDMKRPGNVEVRVADAGKPISLVLISYMPTNWNIVCASPSVQIARVMATSYLAPINITGLAPNVKVEKSFYASLGERGQQSMRHNENPYEIFPMTLMNQSNLENDSSYQNMKKIVEEHLHDPIQLFEGCYREGHFDLKYH